MWVADTDIPNQGCPECWAGSGQGRSQKELPVPIYGAEGSRVKGGRGGERVGGQVCPLS